MFIKLQQHVFQPVPHPQGELHQLGVHTLGYHWGRWWNIRFELQTLGAQPWTLAEWLTHVCTSRCNPGAVGVLSWCPPTGIWWRRVRRTCRTSCCRCRKPVTRLEVSMTATAQGGYCRGDANYEDLRDRTHWRWVDTRPAPGTHSRVCCPSPVCKSCHVCKESCHMDLQEETTRVNDGLW